MNTLNQVQNQATEPQAAESAEVSLHDLCGSYKAYDSQLEIKEIGGTRIVKCLYQTNKNTNKKIRESEFVRIPTEHLNLELVEASASMLAPYVLSFLQNAEEAMIKAEHKAGAISVYTRALSLSKVMDYLDTTDQGSRLNKDMITEWFAKEVATHLKELFIAKGVSQEKLAFVLGAYEAKFCSLASPKANLVPEDCISMIDLLEKVAAERGSPSSLDARFTARLEKLAEKENDLLLAL
ncbi:MAG: hypothetical protein COB66_01455 [Coxiella sp. (in: Bacteria)]|nr:MAG: hypothetical protein COB66_01455 [Coxiella sp. (in: g-proteobacteria)]